QHPQFVLTSVTARSAVGKRLYEIFPQLDVMSNTQIDPRLVITEEPGQTDLAFVCLPHTAAAVSVMTLLERGTKVVDLSADFRLRDVALYEEWYKHTHPAPALLETAVYGLCERYRAVIEVRKTLVANPGCYATAAILGLLPALATGIIEPDIIIDAKSGSSGAGRSLTLSTHFAEANEDVSAYSLSGHRHLPEITQELEAAALAGEHPVQSLRITFVPHLIPMTRGILATCYANLDQESISTTAEVRSLYEEFYMNEPFVRVVDQPPHTKWTYGSNQCLIYPMVDTRTRRLLVISCLDNLVKGAAGQAIQNANRLFGLPETAGLLVPPLFL
ncbi:MAG TPA: N-acetyl-gamma-glutamyl-phosphate reductase, partial [Ktedonobacteraceae bacterium]